MKNAEPRRRTRPTPTAAIQAIHARHAAGFSKRGDRYSQLLSRAIRDEPRGQGIVTTSGLTDAEHAEMVQLAPKAHDDLRIELNEALARLRELITVGDPFYILSVVHDLNLMVPWGEYYEPTHTGSEAKVELAAGLLATQPVAGHERPSAAAVQAILDEIDHVLEVVLLFNLSMPVAGDPAVAGVKFSSASRWMSVRGASFAGQGEDLAKEIYAPQDGWLLATLGFTFSDVLKVGHAVVTLMAERRNALGSGAVDAANEELRSATGLSESKQRQAQARAIVAFIAATEDGLREARTVTAEQICQRDPTLDVVRVAAVLKELSVSVGALEPSSYTGLYDENPLRNKPFLEFDGDYLLALPGAITRDVDRLLESRVLEGNPGFSKQRAQTLDRLAVGYLRRLLPGAAGYTNLFYEGTELDGLVLFEDTAFVVEGKGSGISVQGQRGDTTRLGRDIEDAVEEAWRQGARAREYLLRDADAVFTNDHGAEILKVPRGRVRKVVIVNPTLHELAGLAPQLPRLRALGLFSAGEVPWSVFINDLRVIADTSENPAVFLHYLVWRDRLPLGERVAVSDEIDLWASYLLAERFEGLHDDGHVIVGNASTDFDDYYDGLAGDGPKREPPRKFLPEPVREFVSRLAQRRPSGWRQSTGVCLDLSIPELAFVDAKLGEVATAAAGDGVVSLAVSRVLLVGVPRGANPSEVLFLTDSGDEDPTFAIACRLGISGQPEIAWAEYRKAVTFEPSEFERQALLHVSAHSPAVPPAGRRRDSR
jgi:hypothetical protein